MAAEAIHSGGKMRQGTLHCRKRRMKSLPVRITAQVQAQSSHLAIVSKKREQRAHEGGGGRMRAAAGA
jgi:hypothetical protein